MSWTNDQQDAIIFLTSDKITSLLAGLLATLAEAGEGGKAYKLNKDRPEGVCWDVSRQGRRMFS